MGTEETEESAEPMELEIIGTDELAANSNEQASAVGVVRSMSVPKGTHRSGVGSPVTVHIVGGIAKPSGYYGCCWYPRPYGQQVQLVQGAAVAKEDGAAVHRRRADSVRRRFCCDLLWTG